MIRISYDVARILFEIEAITINTKTPYKFTTGILSPIYIDNRLIISFPEARRAMARHYINFIKRKIGRLNVDLVSGTATAAIPMASWVAGNLNLPMVYVRMGSKKHGKKNKIEGKVKNGQRVVIIEDHVTTAGSCLANVNSIRELGGRVRYVVAATTYSTKLASENFKKTKVKFFSLTDLDGILKVAVKEKIIKSNKVEVIKEWAEDPELWTKKHKSVLSLPTRPVGK